ncbi:MAG: NAD-dependent epimerase/dehydratase family protein [Kiritimatiellae bacterium]|nr:NAD-dependent epimerase/dehydratase family protein [Kiritimatiellia bacterium]
MASKRILVTGTAGFIGFHLAKRLIGEGFEVFGIDNFNDYYPVALKEARHAQLEALPGYSFARADLADKAALEAVFRDFRPDCVVNLAAQAGVRYSITNPDVYIDSNIIGFFNILECCRHAETKPRLLYASSSSVYGGNKTLPFSEDQAVDHPVSLYAATKKSNELMAHCYSHLYGFQALGFRFFTVYGPWGRPDMAAYLFADAMSRGEPIKVFNNGEMYRDFTFIDDIVSGLVACIRAEDLPQYEVYNIGNHRSERLMDMIAIIAHELGIEKPAMIMMPMQDGDVPATYASIDKLRAAVGYEPTTPIQVGLPKFISWFKEWKGIRG